MTFIYQTLSLQNCSQNQEIIERSKRPNVCHFTKSMTEQLLQEQRADLPLSIVRPTIICGALKEPLPGWVVNMDTATGLRRDITGWLVMITYTTDRL